MTGQSEFDVIEDIPILNTEGRIPVLLISVVFLFFKHIMEFMLKEVPNGTKGCPPNILDVLFKFDTDACKYK